jgi:dipeptidyl aminopeptidase/acylaminoacyl peptidase
LIDEGIADSSAIGITGHSWSGYQAAFLVTQTNIFAAAVAGAPVSNMTSAYSGIRLGSGLARQFQYEMGQSRIGGNLWDSLDAYIRNSPVMQAQKSNTPLMIMFGNRDWAVPWQQGQELYLAWRRLNKNCIFLEYFDEPHWPEKFFNRLDYAIRMKEFFDTYCLKQPAPDWILKGVPYKGTAPAK